MLSTFLKELRRRRTFRTAGLYIVGAWLVMQVADLFFPAWGLPDSALNVLLIAAVLGFPIALVFGWLFDITDEGIVRTPPLNTSDEYEVSALRGKDYAILAALGTMVVVIALGGIGELVTLPSSDETSDVAVSRSAENTIAVLPFANTTRDPDNEAFCDGISEEILHMLGRVTGLQVIGRTSSFSFKNSDFGATRIATALGVHYLLQGSVRRDGDDVRITASLVDKDGRQHWSQQFDRRMEGIFAIQSEIAEIVTATIAPTIAFETDDSYRPDPYVYQSYLAGRELLRKRDDRAIEQLEKATQLDPNYAEAHAELATALMLARTINRDYARAGQVLDTALALKPALPRALAARGLLLSDGPEPDLQRAEEFLRAALTADPVMVDAMNWLGNVVSANGRFEEEFVIRQRAVEIDPLHGVLGINMAMMYAQRGRVADAEHQLQRLLDVPDPPVITYTQLRDFYEETGQIADMIAIEKVLAEKQEHTYFGLSFGYALLEMWPDADYWVKRSQQDLPDFPWIGFGLYGQLLPFWQGNYSLALTQLERGIAAAPDKAAAMEPVTAFVVGVRQALVGRYAEAIVTLEATLADNPLFGSEYEVEAVLALAWAYRQTGDIDRMRATLAPLDATYARLEDAGTDHQSRIVYRYAVSAIVQGSPELALERLSRAVDRGWRRLIVLRHDPRWDSVRGDARFTAMVARLETELADERTKVAASEERRDFIDSFERQFGALQ
ncbi:MAG: tetratricopeptide repeat protein [Pseudomonadota bacterium]